MNRSAWRQSALIIVGLGLPMVGGRQLLAQGDSSSKRLLTRRDAVISAGALAATAALTVFDPRIARFFQDTTLSHVRRGQQLDDVFTHINETTLTAAGILTYGVGRLIGSPTVTDIALHTTEAIVAASVTAQVIRGPLGRSRPHVTGYQDQYDFHWFKGFGEFKYRAFPSIHSGSGFAAATAIVAETQRRRPAANWVVAPIAYSLALTPGLSRMYLGQHWASDIAAGAFLGTLSALKVVQFNHAHPGNRVNRIFIPAADRLEFRYGGPREFSLRWTSTF